MHRRFCTIGLHDISRVGILPVNNLFVNIFIVQYLVLTIVITSSNIVIRSWHLLQFLNTFIDSLTCLIIMILFLISILLIPN